ncbi:MAG: AAA family ATPase [Solirubrobacteraceae bacterium]|nr:AAA family ATPase [Solirubrobacteraceae bacterium]
MVTRVDFHRFKQFGEGSFDLHPSGLTLVAGGNNSGKSSLLHGFAVWEFCRTAIEMERGEATFVQGQSRQGLGLGDEEFSPINVPSLKHLWTNLKTQKDTEPDGYTLKIRCDWESSRYLEFGLSLANDRLFIKTTDSNLAVGDAIPRLAYLPPFAGITDREMRLPGAIRRRRIGEGLAGAVLRNLLLDMYDRNVAERTRLRGARSKISNADLRRLRDTDPWELLQQTLRTTFAAELSVAPFREEYHSYIQVEVDKGTVDGYKLTRFRRYNPRDLMVEGSGFLQWLSVYALATDPAIDVLLLDEPDAHLHSSLQEQLLETLRDLAAKTDKQVLVATHSSEILRNAPPSDIFELRTSGRGRYLAEDVQKVGLLAGLGSDYAPRVDRIKRTKRVLFVEGRTDLPILRALATTLGIDIPPEWVEWRTTRSQKERKQLYLALLEEIPDLVAISLRDRDDEPLETVGADLSDKSIAESGGFFARKWRRRYIESYLIWPPAIAAVTGLTVQQVEQDLMEKHALAVGATFTDSDAPQGLLDVRAKQVLKQGSTPVMAQFNATPLDVAEAMEPAAVCEDVKILISELIARASGVVGP